MLESQRGFLLLAFAAVSFFLFLEWQNLETSKITTISTPVAQSVLDTIPVNNETPALNTSGSGEIPTISTEAVAVESVITPVANSQRFIEVVTDTLRVVIDTKGGDIVEADLVRFAQTTEEDSKPVRILSNTGKVHIAVSGISGATGPDTPEGRATYSGPEGQQRLADGVDQLDVPLTWQNADGVRFTKTFSFTRGSHAISMTSKVENQSSSAFNGQVYTQLKREPDTQSSGYMGMSAYIGSAYGTKDKKFQKYSFDDIKEKRLTAATEGGWVSFLQHYFISAWVPETTKNNQLYSNFVNGNQFIIGVQQPAFTVAPGETHSDKSTLYIGPKIQDDLEKIAEGLDLTVDYGFLWWIGQPLFWLLTFLHGVFSNWGVAIIFVTVLVKLALYPLASAQYRSFAKMRILAPKLQSLKERHGDDRQAMSQAMMDLYRKEKVNPLGGCLPILLTMPVFLALYWVLMESVELRHAPFMLWITDLSVKDPFYVLPVLMGISMWVTQKMQPMSPTMDPMQQKMMQYLPVIMSVFFLWFPAGLVLYWLVNNLLSIAQQYYITQKIEAEAARKK